MPDTKNAPTCFVMQPFDSGKFDKRYNDVFAPAILAAGLKPYRVDRDPSADILIEDIERGIESSAACLAEITTDNPNVWYELGFAVARGVPTCMICSPSERSTTFPFDVRHRKIITYDVGSSSDFNKLQGKITERLRLMVARERQIEGLTTVQTASTTAGLQPHEIALLTVIAANFDSPGVAEYSLKRDMDKAGFTDLAAGLATQSLSQQGFIDWHRGEDSNGEDYKAWRLTDAGSRWLLENQSMFQLRKPSRPRLDGATEDTEIPF